ALGEKIREAGFIPGGEVLHAMKCMPALGTEDAGAAQILVVGGRQHDPPAAPENTLEFSHQLLTGFRKHVLDGFNAGNKLEHRRSNGKIAVDNLQRPRPTITP